jgi:hypothetical protein
VVTDWAAIIAANFAIPTGHALPGLVDELLDGLCSPDPALRDEQAYPVLAAWIMAGHLDGQLASLGEQVTGLLAHPQIQARTFAALILAVLVHRDTAAAVLDAQSLPRWTDRFAHWWLAETDLRGWDDQLGWLHAMAHGADVIGELGLSPRLGGDDLARLLDLTGTRLLTPTGYVFAHQEDDRTALALATVLARPELTAAAATGWLGSVHRYLEAPHQGPVPAPAANTTRTLRSLYLMADRGFRPDPDQNDKHLPPHRAEILAALSDVLRLAFPHQL